MVKTPIASSEDARRFHSFLASGRSHDGHFSSPFGGMGSWSLSGRLPGLPSSTFSAVGLGFLPRAAMGAYLLLPFFLSLGYWIIPRKYAILAVNKREGYLHAKLYPL